MQWPDAASTPRPAASVSQNVAAAARSPRRAVISSPPTRMTAYASDHPGAERRPPEVERLEARAAEHDEHDDEPDVRRVEHVRAAVADEVLGRQRERGDAGEHPPGVGAPVVADGVLGTRRISATPLPVSIALAGHTNARCARNVIATSMTAHVRMAARICGTLTWKRSSSARGRGS